MMIVLSVLLQVLATQLPFMPVALGTMPLSPRDWGLTAGVCALVFVGDEIRKAVQRTLARRRQTAQANV